MRCSCQSKLLTCLAACRDCHGKACLNSRKNTFDYCDVSSNKNFDDLLEKRNIFENYFNFVVNALSFLTIRGRAIKLEIRGVRFSVFVNRPFWK